jgi:hypothetical protein
MAPAKLIKNQKTSTKPSATSGAERKAKASPKPAGDSAERQRLMILNMFFDEDNDGDGFIALVKHCRIDLAACDGSAKQLMNVIAGHYRIAKGRYDIDRAANDLLTYPPMAEYIEEQKAKKARRAKR